MEQHKTESKKETLNRLFKENGLLPEDVHKHNHYTIINRQGIEKIQAKNGVTAHFEAIVMERDFAVVKGTFTKEGVLPVETFGSASKETSQNKYYAEMAEKRCLSRGVLKICKFYELGVYGEDEADDFKNKTGEAIEASQHTQSSQSIQDKGKGEKAPQSPANAPTEAKITPLQQENIKALLEYPEINRQEKTKMLLHIFQLTEQRAKEAIDKLLKTINERGGQVIWKDMDRVAKPSKAVA